MIAYGGLGQHGREGPKSTSTLEIKRKGGEGGGGRTRRATSVVLMTVERKGKKEEEGKDLFHYGRRSSKQMEVLPSLRPNKGREEREEKGKSGLWVIARPEGGKKKREKKGYSHR